MNRLVSGVIAGLGATGPMTLAMVVMHHGLPARQRYPLPPRLVTLAAASKVGATRHLDESERTGLTLAAHFAYGAAVGGVFGLIAPRDPAKAIVSGAGYGLIVWAASYLGLLPALRLHRNATREPAERNALMIAAHVVWGVVAGAVASVLRGQSESKSRRLGNYFARLSL